MKKAFLAVTLATTMISTAHAASKASASTAKKDAPNAKIEKDLATIMLEEVLNSIHKASINVNINKVVITSAKDPKTGESKTDVALEDVRGDLMLSFYRDWTIDLINVDPEAPKNNQIQKIFPKLEANANSVILAAQVIKTTKASTYKAAFFANNDNGGDFKASPMTLTVSNKMNNGLLKVRLSSLSVETHESPTNPKVQIVSGTCDSDKMLYDFTTHQTRTVKADCRISGELTDDGFRLELRYADGVASTNPIGTKK